MVLHRHFKGKKLFSLTFVFIELNQLVKGGLIVHVAPAECYILKILAEIGIVKAEIRIHRIPVPAGSAVGMKGRRLIPRLPSQEARDGMELFMYC